METKITKENDVILMKDWIESEPMFRKGLWGFFHRNAGEKIKQRLLSRFNLTEGDLGDAK